MNLPTNEIHKTSEWTLKSKRIVIGINFEGEEVRTNVVTFECDYCLKQYIRFIDEPTFQDLTVEESSWEWGWER